jgi:glycosyltransferase involved in cell wall biosynthesis
MDISVIISVRSADYDVLAAQLEMLRRQLTACDFEVIVGDNSGRFVVPPEFSSLTVRVVDASDRPGASHARNRAVDQSSASLLLFCDADDLVAPDWVDAHRLALMEHPLTTGSFLTVSSGDRRHELAVKGLFSLKWGESLG